MLSKELMELAAKLSKRGDYERVSVDPDTIPIPPRLRKIDPDKVDRQLLEIDENLMRADLTPTQQAEHLAKREQLWADKQNRENGASCAVSDVGKGGAGPGRGKKGFAGDTAKKTGMSKASINRAKARAERIPEDVRDQIRGTDLDKGTYLDRLKGMDPDAQRQRVAEDMADPGPAKAARGKPTITPLAEGFRAWNKMSDAERDEFRAWVMDGNCGGMAIDEAIERLRWALRDGRIAEEHRGAVKGILKQAKSGHWYPTPAQVRLMRMLLADLGAPEGDLIDDG